MLKSLTIFTWLLFHPVHVTLTSIDQGPESDTLRVFVKVYYDDFLLDYQLFANESFPNNSSLSLPLSEALLNKYIDEKVNIYINNKRLKGKLLSQDLSDNELRLNLIYKSDKKPKLITVRNTILTNIYVDQANMTIIRINDFEEGIKLTPQVTEQTFSVK
jgi:hypothetical protein